MEGPIIVGSIILVSFAFFSGKHLSKLRCGILFTLTAGLVFVHSTIRPENLFEFIGVAVPTEGTLSIRLALRRLEREGKKELAAELGRILLDDARRVAYMKFGPKGLIPLKNASDVGEFSVKVLGSTLLWYLEAIIMILVVHFSSKQLNVLPVGLFLLSCMLGFEIISKETGSNMFQSFRPFDTAYDIVELGRVVFVCLLALYTFICSVEAFDRRQYVYDTAVNVLTLNKKLLSMD